MKAVVLGWSGTGVGVEWEISEGLELEGKTQNWLEVRRWIRAPYASIHAGDMKVQALDMKASRSGNTRVS
jgi:hypothetical protein